MEIKIVELITFCALVFVVINCRYISCVHFGYTSPIGKSLQHSFVHSDYTNSIHIPQLPKNNELTIQIQIINEIQQIYTDCLSVQLTHEKRRRNKCSP